MSKAVLLLFVISTVLAISCGEESGITHVGSRSSQLKLIFEAPDEWVSEEPSSGIRLAQYRLPRAKGDVEDGSLVLYYFSGRGGSVEANLNRWIAQMEQPDGSPSREKARIEHLTVNGLRVTTLDISGTYHAGVMPMSAKEASKPNFRLLAAVVETRDGPYFFKILGPSKTLARWSEAVKRLIRSLQYK